MANKQLIKYIGESRKFGMADEQIKKTLLNSGWLEQDVYEALNSQVSTGSNNSTSSVLGHPEDQQSFINRWSWGGFLMCVIYFLGSRDYKRAILYFIGGTIPLLNIYLIIRAGLRGRKLTWESGQWHNFEHYKKRQEILDKIGFILLLLSILVFIVSSVSGYFSMWNASGQAEDSSVNEINISVPIEVDDLSLDSEEDSSDEQSPATVDSDIDMVTIVLSDISRAYISGNKNMIIYHSSAETAPLFEAGIETVDSFIIDDVFQLGPNVLAKVIIGSDGVSTDQNMVFIKENNDWKFDFDATAQYEMDKVDELKGTGDQNGFVDFIITGITISPDHPIINNRDVKVNVSIKNIGTKTSDEGISFTADVLGFPMTGGVFYPITPGATVTSNLSPYMTAAYNPSGDMAEQQLVRVTLNEDREVIESNYDNNVFTETLRVYVD